MASVEIDTIAEGMSSGNQRESIITDHDTAPFVTQSLQTNVSANVNGRNAISWSNSGRMRNNAHSTNESPGPRIGKGLERHNRPGTLISSDPNCINEKQHHLQPKVASPAGHKTATRIGSRVGAKNSQLSVRVVNQSSSIRASPIANESTAELGKLQLSRATRDKLQRPQAQRQQSTSSLASIKDSCSGKRSESIWVPLDVRQARIKSMAISNTPDLYQWRAGPSDSAGVMVDLSDRPLMCMSVRGNEAAIGCADHSVYTVDVVRGKRLRNLYNKRYGHTEWVTCVEHLQDGRILSGALDKKLCLWDATGVRCTDLLGHDGSISSLKVIDSTYAVSASYDKTLMLWNLTGSRGRASTEPVGCLRGHKGAVLGFAMSSEGSLMSGSRDGEVFLWDASSGTAVLCCKNAHHGHVTAVECLRDIDPENSTDTDADHQQPDGVGMFSGCMGELFLTGGQDGIIQVWDIRNKAPVHTFAIARSEKGRGAVSSIGFTNVGPRTPPLMVTASADKIIRVLEPRSSFGVVHTFAEHKDFIYSLHLCGPLMWSGAGDGKLLVHDLTSGECLYGLGATHDGAVRCVSLAGAKHLVIAGDDGNCMMYSVE
ncbi:hypothetical protein R1sor_002278 [Riccia sorocarpa]|uniref:Guanine nucleotide-binding protein subunit beta-like protein n=1 Tax=Riccia sorocarpa TaxID=122646 RepID=A0ABD3H0D6_9MARC